MRSTLLTAVHVAFPSPRRLQKDIDEQYAKLT